MRSSWLKAGVLGAVGLWSMAAMASGRIVGNGGDVVVCKAAAGRPASVRLLDFVEGEMLKGIRADLGGASLTVEQKVQIALSRLERLSPQRAALYRGWAADFFAEAQFLSGANLVDIPDSDHIAVPDGCEVQQIANQNKPLYPGDNRYIVEQRLWQQLDNDNRAGLVLHEIIYREALSVGQSNSVSTRVLNYHISSTRVDSMSVQQFSEFLRVLGFTVNSVQGVSVDMSVAPEFYASGQLKSAKVIEGSEFVWRSNKLSLRDTIEFFPNGQPQRMVLQGVQSLAEKDLGFQGAERVEVEGAELTFYPNGQVATLPLHRPLKLTSAHYDLEVFGWTRFFPSGLLQIARVQQGRIEIQGAVAYPDLALELYASGGVKSCRLTRALTLKVAGQGSIPFVGSLMLSESQEVLSGQMQEPRELMVGTQRLEFTSRYPVQFFANPAGRVRKGCLNKPARLRGPSGGLQSIPAREIIELDPSGAVTSWLADC